MRSVVIGILFVLACSKESSSHDPPSTSGSAAREPSATPDASPAKTDVDGIPVIAALANDTDTVYGVALDAERVFVIGTSIHVGARKGGPLKILVDVKVDDATEKPLVTPSNEKELARHTVDSPHVAAAARTATTKEFAKYYRNPVVRGGFLYVENMGTQAREWADATIERVPVAGGAPEVIVKDITGRLSQMFVDDQGVTVVTQTNAVLRYPLAGAPVTLFPVPTTTADVKYGFAATADNVFIAESTYDADFKFQNATITRIPTEKLQMPTHASIVEVASDAIWLASERYVLRLALK